ncbi:PREDICTED: cytochrome P450 20A1 isoform X2 [Nanorana parkeri]|uniref:cytochrome P450 20A1 isoform X1 n=1 Tax=Nanorana parkeri TaxID=125878 RepID=UPI0008540F9E|nr:PREDICTED: cytochrome P450 20A1 isoform X1 [Nanorana parkeri]XP_018409549.1 PREDICTED: cytochrome P450 20A1 isoform X2 [Nanorana parkeri]
MLDFAIFAITFLLILVGAVLYLYPSSRQACGIPGLAPTEEKDGNLQDIVNTGSLHEFLVNLHEKFGPVASFWFGRRLVVSLGSLDLLKQHINPNRTSDPFQTMLKSLLGYQSGVIGEAAESHIQKKLYENAINKSLQSNFSVIIKLSEELLSKWISYPQGQHVPLCQHMLGFAMKSVTQTAMGSSFEDDQEVIRFRKNHDVIWSEIGKGFLDGSIERSPSRKKQYENALMEMEALLKKAIKARRGKNLGRYVFVDSLLQGNLGDKQVLEDSMIFSLAGCVITANLCTWAIYFLTTAEGVQDKLYKEITRVLGKGPITVEKLDQLSYCRQILSETVRTARLTPISARLQELEGRVDQHVIPKETLVLYALGVVLQDSTTWPSSYRFNPDRFEEESAGQNLSLLGFSGSQECPELRFAYMVATVLLCVLVRKLHLLPVEGQVMETKFELVTSPKEEAWITVSKRS